MKGQFGNSRPHARLLVSCESEEVITGAVRDSVLFGQDLFIIRKDVAKHRMSAEQGVRALEFDAPLDANLKEQLHSCLGKIASGTCQNIASYTLGEF
ncbi:MAG TPA: hypothetical protein PKD20_01035 [Candidatus Saccharibacteria bacterium]|nr:hypothetical protein [Candidatus Saccharibacteria bacterium]HMT55440.1 hypothetical protein [Candidatus Saccharibacteria bacterium]